MAKVQIIFEGETSADVSREVLAMIALFGGAGGFSDVPTGSVVTNLDGYSEPATPVEPETPAPGKPQAAPRGRAKKAESAAAAETQAGPTESAATAPAAATSAPTEPSSPSPASATSTPAAEPAPAQAGDLSRQDVLNAMNALAAKKVDVQVIQDALQARFGVTRVSLLPPEHFQAAIDMFATL